MKIANQMTNLGEDIASSFDARMDFLGKNVVDVRNLKSRTQRFLGCLRKDRKALSKQLREDLGGFVENLTDTADHLRQNFHKQQNAVRQECKQAHQSWQGIAKTLASKRRNFKGNLQKAMQKAKHQE